MTTGPNFRSASNFEDYSAELLRRWPETKPADAELERQTKPLICLVSAEGIEPSTP
jgi:hypothetical protein